MTLQQLRYFLAAADHGSFSAAGAGSSPPPPPAASSPPGPAPPGRAQPSLSDQIRRLEAELGVPLFVRAGRRLELTEAGRVLRPHAERTLAAAEEAAASVRQVRTLEGGMVEFGTFNSAHHYVLGGLVQ